MTDQQQDTTEIIQQQNETLQKIYMQEIQDKFNPLVMAFTKLNSNKKLQEYALKSLDEFRWWAFESISLTNFITSLEETPATPE